jgi:bifunctional DNase/RNase
VSAGPRGIHGTHRADVYHRMQRGLSVPLYTLPLLDCGRVHGRTYGGLFVGQRPTAEGRLIVCHSSPRDDASSSDNNSNNNKPDDTIDYLQAEISEVRTAEGQGNVIFLRLKDGSRSILPVYIGEYECGALIKEMHKRRLPRPGTHDLLKNLMDVMGYRVTQVRVTALVGNIYHARVHVVGAGSDDEISVDSRPSDAINMAVRYNAPIYVNKEVALKMAHPGGMAGDASGFAGTDASGSSGSMAPSSVTQTEKQRELVMHANEIIQSCRQEILLYQDPTMMHKLQMQLAVAEERYEDAGRMRDMIEKLLASDRSMSLVIAIETALEDQRLEEAARLRDELKALRDRALRSVDEI